MNSKETLAASDHAPETRQTLRHNYLSFIENTAQTLGVMAPTGTMGIVLPLLIMQAGNATWISFLLTFIAFSLILYCIYRFARHCATAGALATYADVGLGKTVGMIAGWSYVVAMFFGHQDLPLEDGRVDLDLIEPGCMHRQVDQPKIGELALQTTNGSGAPMAGAAVDDPEDATRSRIGR